MMRIGVAVEFDEARRLDDPDDLGVDRAPVETVPGNIVERPMAHAGFRAEIRSGVRYTPPARKNLRSAEGARPTPGADRISASPPRALRAWPAARPGRV